MRRFLRSTAISALIGLGTAALGQIPIVHPSQGLRLGTFGGDATRRDDRALNRGYAVQFAGRDRHLAIVLPANTSFADRTHLDLRLTNHGARAAQLEISMSSGGGTALLASRLVLGVNESAEISVPLLFASAYGLRALPTISDVGRLQTVSVGSLAPATMGTLYLRSKGPEATTIQLERMEATNHTVPLTNILDGFGQQRIGRWSGKALTVAEIQRNRQYDPAAEAYAYGADAYGGVTGGRNFGADTKFRLIKDHGRWTFVTPAGNRFFSLGVNEVGAHAWSPITGREGMFTNWTTLRSQFPAHFSTLDGRLGYVPYAINLQRKYGTNWRTLAEAAFTKRLKAWGFNTLGIGSWESMIAAKRIPSTFGGAIVGPHRLFTTYDGRAIHDVWDPLFAGDVRRTIQERMATTGGSHEASVGIFLDNELPWGDRDRTETRYRYGLAVGALNAPDGQAAHEVLLTRLMEKYGTIVALNAAWRTAFPNWAALDSGAVPLPTHPTTAMAADFEAFGREYATRYFSVVRDELRERGYTGPYLGCRFEPVCPPEVVDVARLYCDVLSFNVYHARPSEAIAYLKEIDHPILISEFAFGANDLGRVGVPYYPTLTDRARLDAMTEFVQDVKGWPNVVGAHWYRWEDLPVTGKADFDNAALGLNSIVDLPYARFTSQVKMGSLSIMEMLRTLG
ncbi:MAG: hypothetical protein ACO1SV_13540 [Fimbriimonas sp.]